MKRKKKYKLVHCLKNKEDPNNPRIIGLKYINQKIWCIIGNGIYVRNIEKPYEIFRKHENTFPFTCYTMSGKYMYLGDTEGFISIYDTSISKRIKIYKAFETNAVANIAVGKYIYAISGLNHNTETIDNILRQIHKKKMES